MWRIKQNHYSGRHRDGSAGERVAPFVRNIRHTSAAEVHRNLTTLVDLIAAAFGEDIGLSGSWRAIVRGIAFSSAGRFVQANLADSDLTPERVLESLRLSRPTIYRLFQHEGGLGAYIRHSVYAPQRAISSDSPGLR